jgi:dimethylaniline monooxygenase (N-oxide forming)
MEEIIKIIEWGDFMLDCIVIGAGPGGLVCTKELIEQGVQGIVCLEQSATIGGVFANTYDNLMLTSSATISMFSDFWIGDGNQHKFWTKAEALDYWQRYAEHFGVLDRIRFKSKVVAVVPQEPSGWQVELDSGDTLLAKRIALAIGNNAVPNYPHWQELLIDIEYSHSKEYRNADKFVGKNVLMVGGGESGSDVALEISSVANKAWVSLRTSAGWIVPRYRGTSASDISTHRGLWGLSRDYGEILSKAICQTELNRQDPVHDVVAELNTTIKSRKGIWGTYGTKTFSLPKAIVHHGCQVVGEIVKVEDGGKTLHTAEGESLQNIDAVVFSTGYKNYVSFMPEHLQSTDPRSLYKHMFHPQYRDEIVWIGSARPGFGSQFPIMEMQSRFFAMICTGEKVLPPPAEMESVACADRSHYLEQFEHNADRLRSLVDYHHYMDDMASLIGCEPPWHYFFSHPHIWLRIVYGAIQSTQFRLRGPGSKESLAQEILSKLPVSKFNHVVKLGLKGRLIYTVKGLIPNFSSVNLRKSSDS